MITTAGTSLSPYVVATQVAENQVKQKAAQKTVSDAIKAEALRAATTVKPSGALQKERPAAEEPRPTIDRRM